MIEVKNAGQTLGEVEARRMMGYGETQVLILSNTEALKELSCVLDTTTAAGKS
jgi:hypothetical protein